MCTFVSRGAGIPTRSQLQHCLLTLLQAVLVPLLYVVDEHLSVDRAVRTADSVNTHAMHLLRWVWGFIDRNIIRVTRRKLTQNAHEICRLQMAV